MEGPPRIITSGAIEGHAAFGILAEDKIFEVEFFDGTSEEALLEGAVWKLFRLEVGLAGASISLGPLRLAASALGYVPVLPAMEGYPDYREAGEIVEEENPYCGRAPLGFFNNRSMD